MFRILLLLLLPAFTPLALAQHVTVEFYHGQNSGIHNDISTNNPMRKCLNRLMGYENYERIGEASCNLDNATYDQWLIPHTMFFMRMHRVDSQRARLELFQDKKSIFKSEFYPKRNTPLIITGPLYMDGQLVLILTTR